MRGCDPTDLCDLLDFGLSWIGVILLMLRPGRVTRRRVEQRWKSFQFAHSWALLDQPHESPEERRQPRKRLFEALQRTHLCTQ
jgi:hypothetical protein